MSISTIGPSYQGQAKAPAATVGTEQENTAGSAEINQLNAEIKQAESEVKKTAKEVQKSMGESLGGASDKVQMLQSKIQMQQQAIMMKRMQIKEIQSPSKPAEKQAAVDMVAQPRMDQYIAGENASTEPDNVYRMEEKDGTRTILFNRPED